MILFELVFLVILVYYCFYEDKDQNRYILFRASTNGRAGLAAGKLLVLFLSVAMFTALFETAEYCLLSVLYGTGDLSVPLSSIPAFRNTTLRVSVGMMLLLSVCFKVLALSLLLAFLYALSTLFGKISLPILILSGAAGLQLLLWLVVSPTASARAFRYVNLFSFVRPEESLGSYVLLKFFGQPVPAVRVSMILILLFLVIFSITAVRVFAGVNQVCKETFLEKLMLKLRKVFHVLQEGSSLFFLELRKVLVQQKKLLVFLFLLLYFGSLIRTSLLPQLFSQAEEAAYQYYAGKLAGKLGSEQEQFLSEEEKRLEGIREEIAVLQEESNQEAAWKIRVKTQELELYESGLQKVKLQILLLSAREGDHYFLNEMQVEKYLADYRRRLSCFLIAAVGLTILTGGFFAPDARAGMDRLIRTTVNGKRKLPKVRVGITLWFSGLLYLGITVPDLIAFIRIDGLQCFAAPFSDLTDFGSSVRIPIGAAFMLVSMIRLVMLTGVGFLSLSLSRRLKSEMISTVILSGGAVLCTAILWILRTDMWGILLRLFGIHFH